MRHFFILLGLLSFCLGSQAQITYSHSEYAGVGDTFLISRAQLNLNQQDYALGGANQLWDFSNLSAATQRTERFVDPNNAGYRLTFISNCILGGGGIFACPQEWSDLTDLARTDFEQGGIFDLLPVSISDVVRHYAIDNQTLEETILGLRVGAGPLAVPVPIKYDNADTLLQFPLTFGNMDSSIREFVIDLNGLGTDFLFESFQKRTNHIEGWGSITTPYMNYPSSLKVKTIIEHQDSITTNGITVPGNIGTDIIYSWYAPAIGWPVMVASGQLIGGLEIITRVEYLDTLQCIDPDPLFIATPVPIFLNPATGTADVSFTNLSQNANQFQWNFGDGATSTASNPSHTYSSGGIQLVQLIACNQLCQPPVCDTLTLPIVIIDSAGVAANFFATPFSPCVGDSIQFDNFSFNANQYVWDFGDGVSSMEESPVHVYMASGSYDVQLISSNGNNQDTIVRTIDVNEVPQLIAGPDTSVLPGTDVQLFANTNGTTQNISWNLTPELSCFFCSDPIASPSESRSYIVTASNGCGSVTDTVYLEVDSMATSVDDLGTRNSVLLFPNPVDHTLTLSLYEKPVSPLTIQIISNNGARVHLEMIHEQTSRISVAHLPSGIYYLLVGNGSKTVGKVFSKN
ncbi:MAG: PKD domain-containing protein [Bacteroidota bacterium]